MGKPLSEAASHYSESLRLARAEDNQDLVCTAIRGLGDVARLQGELTKAQHYYESSRKLGIESKNKREELLALESLGAVSFARGDLEQAQKYYSSSDWPFHQLYEDRKHDQDSLGVADAELGEAVAQKGGADVLCEMGEPGAALSVYDECQQVFARREQWRELADTFRGIGHAQCLVAEGLTHGEQTNGQELQEPEIRAHEPSQRPSPEERRESTVRYEGLIRPSDQQERQADEGIINIAEGLRERHRHEHSQDDRDESLEETNVLITAVRKIDAARDQPAIVRSADWHFDASKSAFDRSLELYKHVSDPRGEAAAYCGRAQLLERLGRFDKANADFRQSIALLEQVVDVFQEGQTRRAYGAFLLRRNDPISQQRGTIQARRARKLFKRLGRRWVE